MLQPVVRRSWGPKGCPPVMYCWDRRDRLSVIGALSRSAGRKRIGLYFVVYERNVTAEEVELFVRDVQRSLGRKLIARPPRPCSATDGFGSSGCRRTPRT